MTDTTASREASWRSEMGLIDHPLTPLIVAWLKAVNRRAAYVTDEAWDAERVARDLLNAALEELDNEREETARRVDAEVADITGQLFRALKELDELK